MIFQESIATSNSNVTKLISTSMNKTNTTAASTTTKPGEIIPGEFIVVLKEKLANEKYSGNHSVDDLINKIQDLGFKIIGDYRNIGTLVIQAVNLPSLASTQGGIESVIAQIKADPRVQSVEPAIMGGLAGGIS
jgi:hypothetical protein